MEASMYSNQTAEGSQSRNGRADDVFSQDV